MADSVSPKLRSENMARIRSKDTAPELMVRRALHAAGLRYCLHRRGLPGRPDLVFPSRRLCVFVHGCFWQGCSRCIDGKRTVKSNNAYWVAKLAGNKARDARHAAALDAAGWRVLILWECQAGEAEALTGLAAAIKAVPALRRGD
ncbi:MAG: DNA mismatch endonuclease Vsr [Alphaproteobacteria bacterium]|nr:DNA mismatch endonuclease Vsr [Alphaproteobacteria bacterium]